MKRVIVEVEKVPIPKYFKSSSFEGGSYIDKKENITILNYMFTNNALPYTVKFGKSGEFKLVSHDDFERIILFFEMMNEQGN